MRVKVSVCVGVGETPVTLVFTKQPYSDLTVFSKRQNLFWQQPHPFPGLENQLYFLFLSPQSLAPHTGLASLHEVMYSWNFCIPLGAASGLRKLSQKC